MISLQEHSKALSSKVIGKFQEDIPVRSGFAGFFPSVKTATLLVDVEVQRDSDTIAVDVQRFTEGNKNKYSKSTEHKYMPPFYEEDYDFATDDVYMNTVALGVTDQQAVNQAIAENSIKGVRGNKKKIDRAIVKQHADVLQTGVVTMKNGDSIDFRRKAASMKDVGAAQYWDVDGSDPVAALRGGMKFLREEGNSSSSTVNVVMRGDAMNSFLNNDKVGKFIEARRMNRIDIVQPQFDNATGMTFHGQVSAGDFMVNLWTYEEKYTNEAGETIYYLDRENVIMLPGDFQGKTVFGGLPYLRESSVGGVATKMPGVKKADFMLRSYSDEKTLSSGLKLSSAPLAVPFTIDKIATLKVLANV